MEDACAQPRAVAVLAAVNGAACCRLTDVEPATQYDKSTWPGLKARFTALFASRPREHGCELLEGSDVCFAPVPSQAEAARHPHNMARGIYRCDASGGLQVAAAPRFQSLAGHEA